MTLDLTDEEAAALLSLLNRASADDRYPLSPRIRLLRAVRAKLPGAPAEPPPARPPTPEERQGGRHTLAGRAGRSPARRLEELSPLGSGDNHVHLPAPAPGTDEPVPPIQNRRVRAV